MRSGESGGSQVHKHVERQPRKVGRRLVVETPEKMDQLVDEYVALKTEAKEPVTLMGLILHLGLSSRESLDRYADRPGFVDSVKKAKSVVAEVYERRLHGPQPVGAIFALKNMGWTDRQEVESRGWLASIDVTKLSDEQLQRIRAGESPLSVLATPAPAVRALPTGPPSTQ